MKSRFFLLHLFPTLCVRGWGKHSAWMSSAFRRHTSRTQSGRSPAALPLPLTLSLRKEKALAIEFLIRDKHGVCCWILSHFLNPRKDKKNLRSGKHNKNSNKKKIARSHDLAIYVLLQSNTHNRKQIRTNFDLRNSSDLFRLVKLRWCELSRIVWFRYVMPGKRLLT